MPARQQEKSLCITEVCSHNVSAAHDEYGDYDSDYIEIYNPTDEAVNLLGWGLSDDGSALSKFVFPEVTIEPGQAIIAWSSDDKYPQEVWRDDYVPSDVHGLGFRISDGESCILTDPDGKVVSTAIMPEGLRDDMTISSSLADLKSYKVDESTPYFVRDEMTEAGKKKELAEPVFSVDGGWFSDDVIVELSCEEGDIFYTFDGSDPDENAIMYEGPITVSDRTEEDNYYCNIEDTMDDGGYYPDFKIDKATVIRAVAISDSGKSDISAQTYFVGLDEEEYAGVSIMSLVVSPDDLFGYEEGIYRIGSVSDSFWNKIDKTKLIDELSFPVANYAMKGRGWERETSIEYLDPDHNKVLKQESGLRIHGGWSVSLNQKSFNIYARPEYDGSQYFNYDFYGDGSSINTLTLRSGGGEDLYLGKMRDVFNQELVSDRAVGTQKAIPCVVFLNGEYWGLYNLQERACDNYVYNRYGVPEDNVVVLKRKYGEYIAARQEDTSFVDEYQAILDYAIDNDMSDDANYRYIESKIDIQSLIDYYILKIYTGCIDAYTNNEAIWRAKDTGAGQYDDGKWRWLANDLDNSDSMNEGLDTPEVDSFIEGNWESKGGPLVDEGMLSALIVNPEFKERFVSSFMDMMENNFSYESVAPRLWEKANVVRTQNVKSQQRFRGNYKIDMYPGRDEYEVPYDENDFGYDIGIIDAFFRERPAYMTEYLNRDLELE